MSYSLKSECWNCKKKDECVDKSFIYGAVQGIHSVNEWDNVKQVQLNKGHKGGGQIVIECSLLEKVQL
jgi:hypothetical protein